MCFRGHCRIDEPCWLDAGDIWIPSPGKAAIGAAQGGHLVIEARDPEATYFHRTITIRMAQGRPPLAPPRVGSWSLKPPSFMASTAKAAAVKGTATSHFSSLHGVIGLSVLGSQASGPLALSRMVGKVGVFTLKDTATSHFSSLHAPPGAIRKHLYSYANATRDIATDMEVLRVSNLPKNYIKK